MLSLDFYIITHFLIGIIAIILGFLVFLKNKKETVNKTFLFLALSVAIWSFSYGIWLLSKDYNSALFWTRTLNMGATLIPVFYLHWIISLLKLNRKKILIFYYSLTIIFVFFSYSEHYICCTKQILQFPYWPQMGWLYALFLVFNWCIIIIYSLKLLLKEFKKTKSCRKQQIKYVIWGSIIGFIGGSTNYPLMLGVDWIPPFGSPLVIAYPLLFSYSMVKHRLMDIKFIMRKYSVYLVSIITITFFAIAVKYFIIKYFYELYQITDILILIISVSIFVPIKNYYYKLANKYFFTSLYNSNEVISSIGNKLQSTLDIYKIYEYIYEEFDKSFHINAFGFLKYNKKADNYVVKYNKNFLINLNQKFENNKLLDIKYSSKNEILILDEIKNSNDYNKKTKKLIDKLIKLKIDIIIPLKIKGKDIGVMVLGSKESSDIYNDEDLQILKIISSQVAIAIENASLYKRIENFNKYLKEKVDEQTKDIKAKSEHLQKLLTMRSEFLNIASHQLRTPVSVIKGVLSILSEDNISEQEKQKLLKMAFEKSIKLNEIINSILKASEMESENFKIKFKTTNLGSVLKEIYNSQVSVLKNKDLKIILNLPKKQLPNIKSDEAYLKHVFNNLINNSLQYTKKGSIIINVAVEKNKIIVKIIDTGIGIPREEIPKLFHKFVRAKNAVESYTDGTGLGLFIVKKIINAHKGAKVYIEKTEIGEGTTMTVEFLINI